MRPLEAICCIVMTFLTIALAGAQGLSHGPSAPSSGPAAAQKPVQPQTRVGKCTPPPVPANVAMASESVSGHIGKISLFRCSTEADLMSCYFAVTKTTPGSESFRLNKDVFMFPDQRQVLIKNPYNIKELWPDGKSTMIMFDNFHEEHHILRAYFLNGRCQRSEKTNLAQGEWTWAVLDFDHGAPDITQARVSVPKYAPVDGWGLPVDGQGIHPTVDQFPRFVLKYDGLLDFTGPVVNGE